MAGRSIPNIVALSAFAALLLAAPCPGQPTEPQEQAGLKKEVGHMVKNIHK